MIPKIVRHAIDLGVTDGLSAVDVKHVRISNVGALVSVLMIAPWLPVNAIQQNWAIVGANLACLSLVGTVLLLNRAGRRRAAAVVLNLAIQFVIGMGVVLFGYPTGTATDYAAALLTPYLGFPERDRRWAHGFALLAGVSWVAVTAASDRFPGSVQSLPDHVATLVNLVLLVVGLIAIGASFGWIVRDTERALETERDRADALVLNVLPPSVADRLKARPTERIVDRYDEVSILFADLVGFTPLSARLSPAETVDILNGLFTAFDAICDRAGVEKIRTIGDGYMAVCGAPTSRADHAAALVGVAREMVAHVATLPEADGIAIRIGIESGEAVAGIVGTSRFHYDVWGDAVNVAARMESTGVPGRIQIGRGTYDRVRDTVPCESRGRIPVKGKGELETWFVC